ncbi:MAG: hypothetical protein HYZ13_15670 [Acidobacteria bacterium]|nr:hypothetical protein [Acidobacteriota bacterium]
MSAGTPSTNAANQGPRNSEIHEDFATASAATRTAAEAILNQLGGVWFQVMTGAKHLKAGERSLHFRLPSTPLFVKEGINAVEVAIDANDLYTLTFMKIGGPRSGFKVTPVETLYCLFPDLVQPEFTRITGLQTQLPADDRLSVAS